MLKVDYLLIGPAHPYRGGISDTQHELASSLIKLGKTVKLFTFKKLYPKFLFPGKSQFSTDQKPNRLEIEIKIHSFNPFNWIKIGNEINKINPKVVIFRYYTPLLAPCYANIIKKLSGKIKKIALVDNWTPHEPKFYDKILNKLFSNNIDSYLTLSENVALEIKKNSTSNVMSGFHPISDNLPKKISKSEARQKLGWDTNVSIVLFYGLIRSYKGLDNLLRAFAKAPTSISNVKLAIVGEFYEPFSKYKSIIEKLKLEKKIYLIPKFADINSTQLYFSSADLISLTYKSASQSGIISLAYHFETPILVTNLIGLKTPIINDKTGLVCSQDPQDISIKMMEMLNLDRNNFFIKNIKNSIKKYSWKQYSKHIINFIDKAN
ncbi:MAG: glycosyltransferase [Flavobacteriaceae bacterium]|nr:glycosyltransferase [Flavobacteriaceae bacterium]